MILDLSKGMSLDLTKTQSTLAQLSIGVNWGQIQHKEIKSVTSGGFFGFGGKTETKEVVTSTEDVDLDVSAIMYDKDGKYVNKIYFGNYREFSLNKDGIKHSGDDTHGDSSKDDQDNETITIELGKLHPKVSKVAIVLVSFRGQDFSKLPYAEMKLYDAGKSNTIISKTELALEGKYAGSTAMTFGILQNTNGNWDFKAVCEPARKALDGMVLEATKYF